MMSSTPRHLLFGWPAREMRQNSHFPDVNFLTQKSIVFVSGFCVFSPDTSQKTQLVPELVFFFVSDTKQEHSNLEDQLLANEPIDESNKGNLDYFSG